MDPGISMSIALFFVAQVISQAIGFPHGYANFGYGDPYAGSYPQGMLPQGMFPSFGHYGQQLPSMGNAGGQMMDIPMQNQYMGDPFGYGGSSLFQRPSGMAYAGGNPMIGMNSFPGGGFPGLFGGGGAAGGQGYPFAGGQGSGAGPFMGTQANFGAPGSAMGSFQTGHPLGGYGSMYGASGPLGGSGSPYGGGNPFAGGFDMFRGGYHGRSPQSAFNGNSFGADKGMAPEAGMLSNSEANAGHIGRSNRTSLSEQRNEEMKLAAANNPDTSGDETSDGSRPVTDSLNITPKLGLVHGRRIRTATR